LEQYLRIYTSEDQDNWDDCLIDAEFAYNRAKSNSTGLSPFEVLYGSNPNVPTSLLRPVQSLNAPPEVKDLLSQHQTRLQVVQDHLRNAQKLMSDQYNKHHRDISFNVGDLVYLDSSNISTAPTSSKKKKQRSKKLSPKFFGPFKILERPSPLNYRLALHPDSRIHPVFHVSLLKPATSRDPDQFPHDTPEAFFLLPLVEESTQVYEGEWEVESILKHRRSKGIVQYLVKWVGFPVSESTWEPKKHLENAADIVNKYNSENGL
jgi:hypothetical protein